MKPPDAQTTASKTSELDIDRPLETVNNTSIRDCINREAQVNINELTDSFVRILFCHQQSFSQQY